MIEVTYDNEDPRIRRAWRFFLCGCAAQIFIFAFTKGGIWIYTPFSMVAAIPLVLGTLGNLIYCLVDSESTRKADLKFEQHQRQFAKTVVAETLKQSKENEENGSIAAKSNADGTNG